jgi:hypothetical protein
MRVLYEVNAQISTTAIDTDAVGEEETRIASRMW